MYTVLLTTAFLIVPIHTMYERKVADRALEMPDLPLYHVPS